MNTGIVLTAVVQPEVGAVILHHCQGCKRTDIYVSEFAKKPEGGDAWHVEVPCPAHNEPGPFYQCGKLPGDVTMVRVYP